MLMSIACSATPMAMPTRLVSSGQVQDFLSRSSVQQQRPLSSFWQRLVLRLRSADPPPPLSLRRTGIAFSFFKFGSPPPKLPDIVKAGDPVLGEPADPVPVSDISTPRIQRIINDMIAVMRAVPAVGLAAPQIGIPLQIIVLEDTKEYISYVSKEEADAQQRCPFDLLRI